MRFFSIMIALAFAGTASVASAQETAPDGSEAFGIDPYVGIMGGYHDFDSDNRGPLTTNCNGASGCPDGGFVEGVAGVNLPLGPVFVGVEGNVAKGFRGLDFEYGAYGRAGFRAGESGLIYGKVGYQWVETDDKGDDDGIAYGLGVEVGPRDIGLGGITGNAGVRLRFELNTFDSESIRPSAGVVLHF